MRYTFLQLILSLITTVILHSSWASRPLTIFSAFMCQTKEKNMPWSYRLSPYYVGTKQKLVSETCSIFSAWQISFLASFKPPPLSHRSLYSVVSIKEGVGTFVSVVAISNYKLMYVRVLSPRLASNYFVKAISGWIE